MREFLVIAPFHFVFCTFTMVIMSGCWSVFQGFLEIDFLSLRKPGSCGLSPSVVVLEESIVQMGVVIFCLILLVEATGDVALFIQVLRPNLGNVQIDHVCVIAIKLPQLFTFKPSCIDWVGCTDVFVGDDVLRLSVLVAWGFNVVDL